ncbi:ATP-binding protein [Jiella endophytica]|uniref:ATP-binding protein n=1 Tax=Jiella endophytica TaxID=2558362 RepID=A0A4Y8REZ3_9HYPH|nr:ATP-binding protein [Jiella endophytica]TFF20842.1 ATP-binding protein [Jiella endophytica]
MRSKRETFLKASVGGVALAMAVSCSVLFGDADASIANGVKEFLGWPIDALTAAFDVGGGGATFKRFLDWTFGPALAEAAGLITFTAAVAFLYYPPGRRGVDFMWPSAPDVLDNNLDFDSLRDIREDAGGTPFLERSEELRTLRLFAGANKHGGPIFMSVTGQEGIGKTRLGLEWLRYLKKQGWDVGRLEVQVSALDIRRAKFRRRTAILIDEPNRIVGFWELLDALLAKPQGICILLSDQFVSKRPDDLSPSAIQRIDKALWGALRLEKLTETSLSILAPHLSSRALREADGRPLYALLGENPRGELARRAAKRVRLAAEHGAERILLIAALAAPISHQQNRAFGGPRVAAKTLQHLFEGEDRTTLKQQLPVLAPEMFADEIVLQIAVEEVEVDLRALVEVAILVNPAAVERRLGSLWTRRVLSEEAAEVRRSLQAVLDANQAERVSNLHQEAERLCKSIRRFREDEDGPREFDDLRRDMTRLNELAAMRPFDPAIRLHAIESAARTIQCYAEAGRFAELEHWANLLIARSEDTFFQDDLIARRAEANVAGVAVTSYGAAGRFDDLERWGTHLIALAENPIIRNDFAIRHAAAIAAVNSLFAYRATERVDDIERWDGRLAKIAEDVSFENNLEMKRLEAAGALNAMEAYGTAGRFADLERRATFLTALAESPYLRSDPEIRRIEAKAAVNAIEAYGRAQRFADLEQWAMRHTALIDELVFLRNDIDIRWTEANVALSALTHYGKARCFGDVERWAARLIALTEDAQFRHDPLIGFVKAKGASNALSLYGDVGRFVDLERWGTILIALFEEPAFNHDFTIRQMEAEAAVNALSDYGKAGRFEDMERWGARLIALINDPAFHDASEIWLQMVKGAYAAQTWYGLSRRLEDMERWGARLISATSVHLLRTNHLGRLKEAESAANAIYFYKTAGRVDCNEINIWRERLSSISRNFPEVGAIQEVAARHGLGYVNQSLVSWPHGNIVGR